MSLQAVERQVITDSNRPPIQKEKAPLGYVDWDSSTASNERVTMRCPLLNRDRIIRDQYVRIEDPLGSRSGFLGRIVGGPFFSQRGAQVNGAAFLNGKGLSGEIAILAEIELQGELVDGRAHASKSRPVSRAVVQELSSDEVAEARLLGCINQSTRSRQVGHFFGPLMCRAILFIPKPREGIQGRLIVSHPVEDIEATAVRE